MVMSVAMTSIVLLVVLILLYCVTGVANTPVTVASIATL